MQLAKKWHKAGVLSEAGLKAVKAKHEGFLDLTKAEAIARAKKEGRKWRIVKEDGKSFPMTLDLRRDRVNFTIKDGKVVEVGYY